MLYMVRLLFLFTTVTSSIFWIAPCGAGEKSAALVDILDARKLVAAAIGPDSSSMGIEGGKDGIDNNYYFFEVSWNNTSGSMIAGHFAVSLLTGIVWQIDGIVCTRQVNPSLERLQSELRQRLGVTSDELARDQTEKPTICFEIQ